MVTTDLTYETQGYGVELRANPWREKRIEFDVEDGLSYAEYERIRDAAWQVEAWFPDGTSRVDRFDSIEDARDAFWHWSGNAWDWVHLGPVDDSCPQCGHMLACGDCRSRYG